jgi:cysteine desulfurase family protein (TIGR01976 family)
MDDHLSPLRERFPALSRSLDGRPCVFADAPGGTQVPASVADAVAGYLLRSNANLGGPFPTSEETTALIAEARLAGADLLGASPREVVFGPNMTTLSFALSRAVARTLGPGDEVLVTRLDHDANVAPWLLAAEDTGASVRWVDIDAEDGTLDLGSLDAVLGPRTRVVAFTLASNALGTVPPAAEIIRRARDAGAITVADGVHLAQHRALEARGLGADVVFCSPYKVFGPHLGLASIRGELLESWRPYKVRPAHDAGPDRWETGTQNHEGLAGLVAAVEYLAEVGRGFGDARGDRREAVVAAFGAIRAHEAFLSDRALKGMASIPGLRLYGIADPGRVDERTPTFAIRLGDRHPAEVAAELGRRGIFVWHGNYYALAVMERLGLEASGGAVRIGFCHYNTAEEVDRVLEEVAALAGP